MVERKRPGEDSLSKLDTSAEVNEMDYKEGQRRKAGQMSDEPEGERQGETADEGKREPR